MIHLTLAGKRIELRNCYEQRDTIKALASPPDVRWIPERKAWSIDARLYDKLAQALGRDFEPLPYSFFAGLPEREDRRYGYFDSIKRNAELAEKRHVRRRNRSEHVPNVAA